MDFLATDGNRAWLRRWRGRLRLAALAMGCGLAAGARAQTGAELYGADIYWNATPNDVNNLLRRMKDQAKANFHMDIRSLSEISTDPEENPVLYRTGHYRFEFSAAERKRLRDYLLAGGMILFNTGLGSRPFYESVVKELAAIFPEQPLQRLTADHPIFHAYYDVDRVEYTPVNLGDLAVFEAGTVVDPEALVVAGLVRNLDLPIKVLAHGDLSHALTVRADGFSEQARTKIEAAGGTAEVLS